MIQGHRLSKMKFLCGSIWIIVLMFQNDVRGNQILHSEYWSEWSTWSLCSAECEYGISTRTRECLRSDTDLQNVLHENSSLCNGAKSQVKICSLKPCPPGETSRHQQSCSQFNSRMFSGKQYIWEPIIHPNDACKLSCRAKGVHFYANLADKAHDGAPCKVGMTEAACVHGVCKQVGCDGVVESGAVKDTCGVCSGDNSSCQTISGIFTSTNLKRGLNYVISIPAGSTSINITELQASRNLLILQTGTGKTFINNDTRSPISAVVEAAGTVFTYGAKSISNPKETIISPGPTNISVILKFLMRGSNPGIMYTFSVPKEVSDTVIQQIRHHSKPVELPPEPNGKNHHNFQASSSDDDESISYTNLAVNPSNIESSSTQPIFGHHHSPDNHDTNLDPLQGVSTIDITHDETPKPLSFESSSVTSLYSSNISNESSENASESDIIHNLPEKVHSSEDLSLETTTYTVITTNNMHSPRAIDNETNVDYMSTVQVTETSASQTNIRREDVHLNNDTNLLQNLNNDTDLEDGVNQESLSSEPTKLFGGVIDGENNDSYVKKDNMEERNVNDLVTGFSNSDSVLGSEKDRYVEIDNKIRFSKDSLDSYEDEILQRSKESVKMLLNSMINSSESEYYNATSISSEHQSLQNTSSIKDLNDVYQPSILSTPETKQQEKEQENKNWISLHSTVGIDISLKSSEESVFNKQVHQNATINDTLKTSQNVSNYNSLGEKKTSDQNFQKNRSRYKIPQYSQSFTFPERYKDTYNQNDNVKNSQVSRVHHNRRRHRHPKSGFHNTSSHQHFKDSSQNAQQGTDITGNLQAEFETNLNRNSDHVQSVDSSYSNLNGLHERDNNAERGNKISELNTPSHTERTTKPDRHQSDRADQVSRETRLRDRQIILEERRRRMDAQRLRYNERLREYQEMLRQRQVEIDESRRRSSHSLDTSRGTDSRSSDESNYHRGPSRHELNPPPSSRDESFPISQQGSRSSGISPHSSHSYTDTGKDTPGSSGSSVRNRDTFTDTDSLLSASQSGHSSDTGRQEQLERRPSSQTDTSRRRQSLSQTNRKEGEVNNNSRIINRDTGTYSSNSEQFRERSNGQTNSPNLPQIIQAPQLEQPESINGDRTNYYTTRKIPVVQPSAPRYISGSPSRAAIHSALTGSETSLEPSSNKVSSDSHILSNRHVIVPNPVEPGDLLPNQISLNKLETAHTVLGSIYEWRVSGLTECTHSCGGGVQQTVVVCVDTLTQAVVTDENCRYISKPKLLGVPCNTRPCSAEWTPGLWTSCSVTCGSGEQLRTITCQARISPTLNITMPSSSCESQEQIPSRQTCINNPCSSWRAGIWSNCSTPCGDGKKTRDVQCADLQNNIVSDEACSELRPDSEEKCNLGECGKGWFFTDWPTECPAECGTGEVTRQVFCSDDDGSALPDSRCDVNQRPALSQSCRASRPCGGLWFTGQWSKCDASCGSGNSRRVVLCIKELSGSVQAVVNEENCEGLNKPTETEPCQAQPCTSEWYMTSWSQCSQSCGTGYRTREVKCLDPDQKQDDSCPLQTRPKTRDACNTHNCIDIEENGIEEDGNCTDKSGQCKVVKRARLCRYGYFKTMCCKSCAEDT